MGSNGKTEYAPGIRTREALLHLLEVHEHGATTPELTAYTGMTRPSLQRHLRILEKERKVSMSTADRNTQLWSLTPEAATERSAVLTPAPALPLRNNPSRARRTR
jgi:DNA-binding MarR family transcriptional regulator